MCVDLLTPLCPEHRIESPERVVAISLVCARVPSHPCPNPGPRPPWEMPQKPRPVSASTVHHSKPPLWCPDTARVRSESRPKASPPSMSSGSMGDGKELSPHRHTLHVSHRLLRLLHACFLSPFALGGRGHSAGPSYPGEALISAQHRGPGLVGVGPRACGNAQVPIPEAPWLRERRGEPADGKCLQARGSLNSLEARENTTGPSASLGTSTTGPAGPRPPHHGTDTGQRGVPAHLVPQHRGLPSRGCLDTLRTPALL